VTLRHVRAPAVYTSGGSRCH